MTSRENFEKWFELTFPKHLYPEGEGRNALMLFTWLAWRDSRRNMGDES